MASHFHLFGVALARYFFAQFSIVDSKTVQSGLSFSPFQVILARFFFPHFSIMDSKTVQRSRRELSNEYLLAKFGFDTAENKPYYFEISSSREFEFELRAYEPLICNPDRLYRHRCLSSRRIFQWKPCSMLSVCGFQHMKWIRRGRERTDSYSEEGESDDRWPLPGTSFSAFVSDEESFTLVSVSCPIVFFAPQSCSFFERSKHNITQCSLFLCVCLIQNSFSSTSPSRKKYSIWERQIQIEL